ncbi:MAG: repair protein RecO [Acidobacteriota bacterium]|nr:repair protein RecO [Acidobacteriota bacterium]
MALFETEAIVLRNLKLGEADKIIVALTKQEGVVRGVAKGARKLKSRYGASLEPFTIIRLTFFEKEMRELVSIGEAEIVKSYFDLTRNDSIFTTLEHVAGLIMEFAPLRSPDERFFRMFKACLEALEEEPGRVQEIALYSEIWTLRLSGFLPDPTTCTSCGTALEVENAGAVLSTGSALTCTRCAGGQGLIMHREALAKLISALKIPPLAWAKRSDHYPADPSTDTVVSQVLHILTARALEREPRFRSRGGANS